MHLSALDLNLKLGKDAYKKRLKKAQLRLVELERKLVKAGLPVIVLFEGWDAGGKGGAIKRFTQYLDPRGYVAHAVSAPTAEEKAHHYLWRFWRQLPHRGQIAIFDRSWYGRVLVERVEGFAKKAEWQRAYAEINNFEKLLTDDGAIVLKFFLHISKEEQLKRFKEREDSRLKNWKLTDEDWRNRKEWEDYVDAINDMLDKTSTDHAPWHVVPGNCKKYARITVCEDIIAALEKRLK